MCFPYIECSGFRAGFDRQHFFALNVVFLTFVVLKAGDNGM